jgi:type IV pilus assembly protein PilP
MNRGRAGWRAAGFYAAAVLAMGLVGCARKDSVADLRAYVAQLERTHPGHVEPLPELKPYQSFVYAAEDRRDPFTPPTRPEEAQAAPGASNIRPDLNRPREPLEAYPLDALRMVGTLERNGVPWALIKAPDGAIYRVHPGNYLGQNYGKVVSIREGQIDLNEIVPDGKGGWQERKAKIELTE